MAKANGMTTPKAFLVLMNADEWKTSFIRPYQLNNFTNLFPSLFFAASLEPS